MRLTCRVSAEGVPSGCQAASRGGAPFLTAALAWIKSGRVRFHPVVLNGHAVAATQSWTVAIEESPAALAAARRQKQEEAAQQEAAVPPPAPPAQPAPAPAPAPVVQAPAPRIAAAPKPPPPPADSADAAPDQPFSTHVMAGGTPTFPKVYDEGRPGAVVVTCMIETNGAPTGCRVVKTRGGDAFRGSVREWLGSGRVRFRPMTVNGKPMADTETWTIVFNHDPADDQQ